MSGCFCIISAVAKSTICVVDNLPNFRVGNTRRVATLPVAKHGLVITKPRHVNRHNQASAKIAFVGPFHGEADGLGGNKP